jgi:hypothetical protein
MAIRARTAVTVSSLSDDRLRQRVRDRMQSGELPRGYPAKLWVAPATRLICRCCDEPISVGYEYEVAFANATSVKFHPRCYVIWDEERAASTE